MNPAVWRKCLKYSQDKLKVYLHSKLTDAGYTDITNGDGFLYAKGNHPVLLVAHMDTVHQFHVRDIIWSDDHNICSSPQGLGGDDRCGVYMILRIIKEIKCSVLFVEDEEIGCIGAQKFCKAWKGTLDVNYIIEFDRRNARDAVYYELDNPEFEQFITESSGGHFKTAIGSVSDISYIAPHFGIAAVNLSCGYYKEHKPDTYVVISEMLDNINKAKQIILTPVSKPFEYRQMKYDDYGRDYSFIDEYAVTFTDKDGATAVNLCYASGVEEAIGTTVMMFGYVSGNDIIDASEAFDAPISADRIYQEGEIVREG